ncbi:MAG: GrpB family protein [Oscillospiraceae bacterium]|nr:GrpB family protein [Oscillospiraceae bacterium]
MRKITVVPHNPEWAGEFERIKSELTRALGGLALAVEHVGSTSVTGLYAKPVIDIDIVIDNNTFQAVESRLNGIGYSHIGDLGIHGREAFGYENKPHLMEHHLYVCEKDADELTRHLALRDFLRVSEEYRDKYSRVKLEMAEKFPHNIDAYIDGKQPLILEIYAKRGLDITYKDSC